MLNLATRAAEHQHGEAHLPPAFAVRVHGAYTALVHAPIPGLLGCLRVDGYEIALRHLSSKRGALVAVRDDGDLFQTLAEGDFQTLVGTEVARSSQGPQFKPASGNNWPGSWSVVDVNVALKSLPTLHGVVRRHLAWLLEFTAAMGSSRTLRKFVWAAALAHHDGQRTTQPRLLRSSSASSHGDTWTSSRAHVHGRGRCVFLRSSPRFSRAPEKARGVGWFTFPTSRNHDQRRARRWLLLSSVTGHFERRNRARERHLSERNHSGSSRVGKPRSSYHHDMVGEFLKHLGINVSRLRKEYRRVGDKLELARRVGYRPFEIEQALATPEAASFVRLCPVGYQLGVLKNRELPDFCDSRVRLARALEKRGVHPGLCRLLEAAESTESLRAIVSYFTGPVSRSDIRDPPFGSPVALGVALGLAVAELCEGDEEFAAWVLVRLCESVERGDFRLRLHLPRAVRDLLDGLTAETLAEQRARSCDGWLHVAVCELPSTEGSVTGAVIEEWAKPWDTSTTVRNYHLRKMLGERGYEFQTLRETMSAGGPPSSRDWPFVSRVQVREERDVPSTKLTKCLPTTHRGELDIARKRTVDHQGKIQFAEGGSPEQLQRLAEELARPGPFGRSQRREDTRVLH